MAIDTIDIRVPALGESIREAVIARWLKRVGEHAADGEPVAELETDKVTVELRAPTEGVLTERKYAEGDTVKIGDVVALLQPGAGAGASRPVPRVPVAEQVAPLEASVNARAVPTTPPPAKQPAATAPAATTQPAEAASAAHANGDHLQAIVGRPPSPALRKALRESGLTEAPAPSAPSTQKQALAGGQTQPASPSSSDASLREQVVPMSPLRRRIAERLVQAQHAAAALTTFNEIDMTNVLALRERYKEQFLEKHKIKLGLMSFFTRAVVAGLQQFPGLNAEVRGDAIVYKKHYDVGVAVGGGKGLVVPVIRDADRLTFAAIESTIADYGRKAKENRLTVDELQGGTFTITNGGVYGSMMSTPLLNFPQTGILGMHNTVKRAVVVGDKIPTVEIRPMMYVALTYDHRVVDGREAVQFLVSVKERIENPERLLLDV